MTYSLFIATAEAMLALGAKLAPALKPPLVIFLHGNLGAGKTTLVQGLIHGLGYSGYVKSPTYTLVEQYSFPTMTLYHFDLYRLIDLTELEYIGFRDYFTPQAICLLEWPERAKGMTPAPDIDCYLRIQDTGREITLQANTQLGKNLLQRIFSQNT